MSHQQFFTVQHGLSIQVKWLDSGVMLPSNPEFESEIPSEFKIACEFSHLDNRNEQAAAELAKHDMQAVNDLFQNQNKKINILLGFFLAQYRENQSSTVTTNFGAGELSYVSPQTVSKGDLAQVTLFLENPSAAVYCYAECVDVTATEQGCEVKLEYRLIREDDRDLLIRAALNQQQKLLRQRSLNRDAE
jgi:hypothetical protein